MWTKSNIPNLKGKTAVVTGSNTGIGYETALALYQAGADVTLACRDKSNALRAIDQMKTIGGRGSLQFEQLNLANLDQVKNFAASFKTKHQKLDLLINNAGVMLPPPALSDDGFELQFAVNFLGHFALTGQLFPLLQQAEKARVVTLSSGAATKVDHIDFENLKLEKKYNAQREYAQSKLADLQFAYELNKRLKTSKASMISVAAHPGVVRTDLQRHIPAAELTVAFSHFKLTSEPWQGALPSLYAATNETVKGGEYYGPDGENEYSGYPALSKQHTSATKDELQAAQLWTFAEEVTKINFLTR